MTPRDAYAPSRRSVLRAGATAGLGLALPSLARATDRTESTDQTESSELTIATRNLGLGANLFALFLVDSQAALARTVGDLYEDIERSAVGARMEAVAAELARTRPDVVGVQEAALVRTQSPGDDGVSDPDAENVAFDFLADLTDALDAAGEPYEVAQTTRNADAEFPADVDGDRIDVRLTDRDAVLVRADADVRVSGRSAATFEESLAVPVGDGRTFRVERGYGVLSGSVDGRAFTAVNAHLESASESVRGAQAEELAAALGDVEGETILLGDLNDGPAFEGGAYERLSAGLTDAWDAVNPDDDGYTCCRATTLDGPGSMDERVDHVLVSSGFDPTGAQLVGADAESRVTATVDGDSRTLWPSDHAGVVATLRVGAESAGDAGADGAATPSTDPSRTAESESGTASEREAGADGSTTDEAPTNRTESDGDAADATPADPSGTSESAGESSPSGGSETPTESPGFGVLAGAVGVLGGAAELVRRRRD